MMPTGVPRVSTHTLPAEEAEGGFDYVVSGLNVRSQLELPPAIRAESRHTKPDVTILLGKVPSHLASAQRHGKFWAADGDVFWLHMPGIMRVIIRGGHSIIAEADGPIEPRDLVVYLLGTAFSVALHQRGRVVVHASAVVVRGRAMLFCGQSGAGKSTMAALLGQRGYPLLNDDVCSLSLLEDEYAVHPDGRMLKLWPKSMEYLEWAGEDAVRVHRKMDKFYRAPEHVDLVARPIGGIYFLSASQADEGASLTTLPTAEAVAELLKNAYRPQLVEAMAMTPSYFQMAVSVKQHAALSRLIRPMDFSRADEALDLLESSWSRAIG
jgi:hypothetical protein